MFCFQILFCRALPIFFLLKCKTHGQPELIFYFLDGVAEIFVCSELFHFFQLKSKTHVQPELRFFF